MCLNYKMVIYLQPLLLLFHVIGLASTQGSPFHLLATRNESHRNIVTMQCNSTLAMSTIGDPLFFLNGSNLEERDDLNVVQSGESIILLLRPDLEGYYTCTRLMDGRYVQSPTVPLVGEFCFVCVQF